MSRSFRPHLDIRAPLASIMLAAFLVLTPARSGGVPLRGPDPTKCFGLEATIVGTTGDDQYPDAVFGTTAGDVIHALAGDDNVYAVALKADPDAETGDDFVCAGPGSDDPVDGGGGDDHIAGGEGSDGLFGLDGNDFILGGRGSDEIESHAGRDVVVGGPNGDELCAGAGRDDIRGGAGADRIGTCGGLRTGVDRYFGGPGDDAISSVDSPEQASADTIDGGTGNDTCSIDREDIATNCETVEVV